MNIRTSILAALAVGLSIDVAVAQANHRLEVVTFPKEVTTADPNLNKEALLYHPTKKSEGKIPLIVLLHGAGGTKKKDVAAFKGNRDVKWVMTPANSKYVAKILVPHVRGHWNPDALNRSPWNIVGFSGNPSAPGSRLVATTWQPSADTADMSRAIESLSSSAAGSSNSNNSGFSSAAWAVSVAARIIELANNFCCPLETSFLACRSS